MIHSLGGVFGLLITQLLEHHDNFKEFSPKVVKDENIPLGIVLYKWLPIVQDNTIIPELNLIL